MTLTVQVGRSADLPASTDFSSPRTYACLVAILEAGGPAVVPVGPPTSPPSASLVRRPVLAPVLAGAIGLGACAVMGLVDPTGGPVLCPFRAATGLACPGCGSTRMLHRLAVGDPLGAFRYNPLAFVFVPLVAWWLFAALTRALGGPRWRTPQFSARATWVLAGVVLAYWVLRNLPIPPFDAISPV